MSDRHDGPDPRDEVLRADSVSGPGTPLSSQDDDVRSSARLGGVGGIDAGAIVALALSISAWLFILPIIGAIAALVIAPSSKRRIRASHGTLTGSGLVLAAQVLSILNLLLGVFIVWVFFKVLHWLITSL